MEGKEVMKGWRGGNEGMEGKEIMEGWRGRR